MILLGLGAQSFNRGSAKHWTCLPLPDLDNLRVTERLIELDADLAIAIQGGIDFNSEWIVSNEDNPRSRNLLPVNF
jgi:hypothetical protein